MIYIKSLNKEVSSRKEAKEILGGTNAFNKALKNQDLIFLSMATIFKYKNKCYQATNLDKKLKRLKVSKDDIEILFEGDLNQSELEKKFLELTQTEKEIPYESWHDVKLYHFKNTKTNETIVSIYDNLNNLPIKKNDWIRIEGNL